MRKRLQRIRDKLRREIEMTEQRAIRPEDIRSDLPAKVVELLARPRLTDLPENPVGRMLEAVGRSPMRPSHLHFMVSAAGLATLVTHIFVAGDEHLGSDAVFGVKESLVKEFVHQAPGTATPDGRAVDGGWARVRFDVVLAPDLFWRMKPGVELGYSEADFKQAFAYYEKFDVNKSIEDIGATMAALKNLPEYTGKVGFMGFCLGGKLAYLTAARERPDIAISFYGVGIPEEVTFAAEYPACTCPCQRFVATLADRTA